MHRYLAVTALFCALLGINTPAGAAGSDYADASVRTVAAQSNGVFASFLPLLAAHNLPNVTGVHTFGAGIAMISTPSDYAGQSIASVLGYPSPVMAVWNPATNAYDVTPTPPANAIDAGQGYWVRFPASESIGALGTPTPTNSPFIIALRSGWNMIGDPFPVNVPLSGMSSHAERDAD